MFQENTIKPESESEQESKRNLQKLIDSNQFQFKPTRNPIRLSNYQIDWFHQGNQNLQITYNLTPQPSSAPTPHPLNIQAPFRIQTYQVDSIHSINPNSIFKPFDHSTENLIEELDECDQSNPLVLHHAKTQLLNLNTPTQPLIIKSKSKSKFEKIKFKLNHSHHPNQINQNFDEFDNLIDLFLPKLFKLINQRKPVRTSISYESVHAIISSNLNLQSNLNKNLNQLKTSNLRSKIILKSDTLNPYKTINQTINKLNLKDFIKNFNQKEPKRLRDVITRITFTFNEIQKCALNCRKVMILISKSYQTLPPGSMKSIQIGKNLIKPPLPLIRHESCKFNLNPSIRLDWSDGTLESFDPTDLSLNEILINCHFLSN